MWIEALTRERAAEIGRERAAGGDAGLLLF